MCRITRHTGAVVPVVAFRTVVAKGRTISFRSATLTKRNYSLALGTYGLVSIEPVPKRALTLFRGVRLGVEVTIGTANIALPCLRVVAVITTYDLGARLYRVQTILKSESQKEAEEEGAKVCH